MQNNPDTLPSIINAKFILQIQQIESILKSDLGKRHIYNELKKLNPDELQNYVTNELLPNNWSSEWVEKNTSDVSSKKAWKLPNSNNTLDNNKTKYVSKKLKKDNLDTSSYIYWTEFKAQIQIENIIFNNTEIQKLYNKLFKKFPREIPNYFLYELRAKVQTDRIITDNPEVISLYDKLKKDHPDFLPSDILEKLISQISIDIILGNSFKMQELYFEYLKENTNATWRSIMDEVLLKLPPDQLYNEIIKHNNFSSITSMGIQ